MDSHSRKSSSNKIREIVRLQQILKKWRKMANTSKSSSTVSNSSSNGGGGGGGSSKSIKFLKRTLSFSDQNAVVPKGYLAVSVGEEQQRFIIPTEYLSHSAFHVLLREAEEEFGFQQAGVLRIPCPVSTFHTILKMVEEKKDLFFMQESLGYCSSQSQTATPPHHPQSPMCR